MYPETLPMVLLVGFPFIALVLLVALVWGASIALAKRGAPRRELGWLLVAIMAWVGIVSAAAGSGVLARFDLRPPPFGIFFISCVAAGVTLARSRIGVALSEGLPLSMLVGFHVFRVPLELVMHEAAKVGVMPVQMSYSGWNFDIITGATALIVAVLAATGHAGRRLVLAWNVLGTVLLVVILSIAVSSLPLFKAFGSEPAVVNTFVAYLPFTLLPAVMVVLAIAGHLILFRRLLSQAPVLTKDAGVANALSSLPH